MPGSRTQLSLSSALTSGQPRSSPPELEIDRHARGTKTTAWRVLVAPTFGSLARVVRLAIQY
jgi:hypothetical protein